MNDFIEFLEAPGGHLYKSKVTKVEDGVEKDLKKFKPAKQKKTWYDEACSCFQRKTGG